MKKIRIILVTLTFAGLSVSAAVQNHQTADWKLPNIPYANTAKAAGDWWQPDTVYGYAPFSEQPNGRMICSYNAQGYVTVQLYQRWQNENWKNYQKYTYTYDTQNNMLTQLWQKGQTENWKNYYKYLWTYDENGNTTASTYWKWEDEEWQPRISDLTLYYNNMQSNINYGHAHKVISIISKSPNRQR